MKHLWRLYQRGELEVKSLVANWFFDTCVAIRCGTGQISSSRITTVLSTHQDWYGVNMRSESHLLFGCNTLLELVTCFPFTDFYRSQWPASCLLLLRNSQKAPHFRQITGNLSHQPILKLSLFLLLHQSLLIHIRRMHQSSQKSRMRQ